MRQARVTGRPVSLLDALFLVGVIGVMLWIYRGLFNGEVVPTSLQSLEDVVYAARTAELLLPCVTAWTVAVLALSLRKPRPPLRRLSRQPGFVACLTATVVVLVGVPIGMSFECFFNAVAGRSLSGIDWETAGLFSLGTLPTKISYAIAASWVILAFSGRWRTEASWIDRLGRATGCFWIAVIPLHELAGVGCLGS